MMLSFDMQNDNKKKKRNQKEKQRKDAAYQFYEEQFDS